MRKYKHSNGISELVVLIALGVVTVTSFVLSNQTTRQQLTKSFAAVQGPPIGGGRTPTPTPSQPRFALSGNCPSITCVSQAGGQYTTIDSCVAAAQLRNQQCSASTPAPTNPPIGGNQPLPTDPPDTYTPPPITGSCVRVGYRCNGNVSQYCSQIGTNPQFQSDCQYGCSITNGRCRVSAQTVPNISGLRWNLDTASRRCVLSQTGQYTSYEDCFARLFPSSTSSMLLCTSSPRYRCNGRYSELCTQNGAVAQSRELCANGCNVADGRCRTCVPGTCYGGTYMCNASGSGVDEARYCTGGVICCKNQGQPNQSETQSSNSGACISAGGTVGRCEFSDDLVVNCCMPPIIFGEGFGPGDLGGTDITVRVDRCRELNGYIGRCTQARVTEPYCNPRTIFQCQNATDDGGYPLPSECVPSLTGGTCTPISELPLTQQIRIHPGTNQFQVRICINADPNDCQWYNITELNGPLAYDLAFQFLYNHPTLDWITLVNPGRYCLTDGSCVYIDTDDQLFELINSGRLTDSELRRVIFDNLNGASIPYLIGIVFSQFPPEQQSVLISLAQELISPSQMEAVLDRIEECVDKYGSYQACQGWLMFKIYAFGISAAVGGPVGALCDLVTGAVIDAYSDEIYSQFGPIGNAASVLISSGACAVLGNIDPDDFLAFADNPVWNRIDDATLRRPGYFIDGDVLESETVDGFRINAIYSDKGVPLGSTVAFRDRLERFSGIYHNVTRNFRQAVQESAIDGQLFVDAHGAGDFTDFVSIGRRHLLAEEFADLLVDSGLQDGTRITLMVCGAGNCPTNLVNTYADDVLIELQLRGYNNIQIRAPRGTLWTNPSTGVIRVSQNEVYLSDEEEIWHVAR